MVAAKETAEEQLLRMIEGSATPSSPPKRPAPGGAWLEHLLESLRHAVDAVRQRLFRPRIGSKAPSDPFLWQLQLVGRLAWIVLAGLGLYVVADMVLMKPQLPRLAIPLNGGGESTGAPGEGQAVPDPLEGRTAEYRQTLAARNPFRLSTERVVDSATGQTVKNRLIELTGPLIIAGINRGRVPEALIEHTEEKRTYFVKVGDTINGVTVTAIDQRGVTVSYEGEEITLQ